MTMIVMTAIMMIITTTIDRGIERRSAPYGALPGNFLIWVLDEREKNAYNEKIWNCLLNAPSGMVWVLRNKTP